MPLAFPGFDHLVQLVDPMSKRPMRGRIEYVGDPMRLHRGEIQVGAPLPVVWEMGGADPTDVLWTSPVGPLMVQQRVIDLLISLGATGWNTFPVTVKNKRRELVEGYHGLSIKGRCGPRDLTRSTIELREYPGGWFPEFRGWFFDEQSWDGSDLFLPEDNLTIIATQQVASALEDAGVKNIGMTPLSENLVSTSTYENGSLPLPADFRERVHRAYDDAGVTRPRRWAARLAE